MYPKIFNIRHGKEGERESEEKLKITIPNMTVVPESAFVNFITLAESVALAPMADF